MEAGFGQSLGFCDQGCGVYYNSRSDHRVFAGTQNSARDQLQDETTAVEYHGVAGVMPASASRDVIEGGGR